VAQPKTLFGHSFSYKINGSINKIDESTERISRIEIQIRWIVGLDRCSF